MEYPKHNSTSKADSTNNDELKAHLQELMERGDLGAIQWLLRSINTVTLKANEESSEQALGPVE